MAPALTFLCLNAELGNCCHINWEERCVASQSVPCGLTTTNVNQEALYPAEQACRPAAAHGASEDALLVKHTICAMHVSCSKCAHML